MATHLDSLWTVLHGTSETWLDLWSVPGAMRAFLLADACQPVMAYATDERKREFVTHMQRDGFEAPNTWYRALASGAQDEANAAAAAGDAVVRCPFLFVVGERDVGCRHADFEDGVKTGLMLDASMVVVEGAGHWLMLANPSGFGDAVLQWLDEKFEVAQRQGLRRIKEMFQEVLIIDVGDITGHRIFARRHLRRGTFLCPLSWMY